MDPLTITLATSAISILTPFLKKGAEKFAEYLGEEAGKKVGAKIFKS